MKWDWESKSVFVFMNLLVIHTHLYYRTIQALALLTYLSKQYNTHGGYLIIVPLTTLDNWLREISIWTHLNVIKYYQVTEKVALAAEEAFENNHANIVLTTYETLKKEKNFFHTKKWQIVIADEAHRLKHTTTKIRSVFEDIHTRHTVLLTGTPFQVHIEELFNLLALVDHKKFNDQEAFIERFGELNNEQQVNELKQLIAPYVLRRTKEEVMPQDLAPKEEIVVELDLTKTQKTLYRAIIEKKAEFLRREFKSSHSVSAVITALKRCCNHPFLLSGVEETMQQKEDEIHIPIEEKMIQSSSKLIFVDKLLDQVIQSGEKILIFCQMLNMMSILEDYLIYKKVSYERLDGSTPSAERTQKIDNFNNNPDVKVFVLSTRAGGLGINLVAANNVVIYDSDFNPFNDTQASARAHRIGQTKKVTIYRLIAKDTYEKFILKRASQRLGLGEIVLGGTSEEETTADEMEKMLKFGVYHFMLNETTSGDELLNENLSSILARSTVVKAEKPSNVVSIFSNKADIEEEAKLEPTPTPLPESQLSAMYFTPTGQDTEIELNDTQFWEKLLPDYADATTLAKRIVDSKPIEGQERDQFVKQMKSLIKDASSLDLNAQSAEDLKDLDLTDDKKGVHDLQTELFMLRSTLHTILIKLLNGPHKSEFDKKDITYFRKTLTTFESRSLRKRKPEQLNFAGRPQKRTGTTPKKTPNKKTKSETKSTPRTKKKKSTPTGTSSAPRTKKKATTTTTSKKRSAAQAQLPEQTESKIARTVAPVPVQTSYVPQIRQPVMGNTPTIPMFVFHQYQPPVPEDNTKKQNGSVWVRLA
jgi:hypothetical protein